MYDVSIVIRLKNTTTCNTATIYSRGVGASEKMSDRCIETFVFSHIVGIILAVIFCSNFGIREGLILRISFICLSAIDEIVILEAR